MKYIKVANIIHRSKAYQGVASSQFKSSFANKIAFSNFLLLNVKGFFFCFFFIYVQDDFDDEDKDKSEKFKS